LAIGIDILNLYPVDFEIMDFAEFQLWYKAQMIVMITSY